MSVAHFCPASSADTSALLSGPQPGKMAAPEQVAGEFENWLNDRLDSLEVDREVYGAYILGVLQEEENDDEKKDALQGILSAFLVSARRMSMDDTRSRSSAVRVFTSTPAVANTVSFMCCCCELARTNKRILHMTDMFYMFENPFV